MALGEMKMRVYVDQITRRDEIAFRVMELLISDSSIIQQHPSVVERMQIQIPHLSYKFADEMLRVRDGKPKTN